MTAAEIEQLADALDVKLYPWQIAILRARPCVSNFMNATRLSDRVRSN